MDGQLPYAAHITPGEHDLAAHVEVLVVGLFDAILDYNHFGLTIKGGAALDQRDGVGPKVGQKRRLFLGGDQAQCGLAAVPLLEAGPGPEGGLLIGGIGEGFDLQSGAGEVLMDELGGAPVPGTGLDSMKAAQVGDGLPGSLT